MKRKFPRLVIAGTHSGVGKSIISIGIMQVLTKRGLTVQGFKVGPDYIDPSYHSYVTGRFSRNLDTFLLGEKGVKEIYRRQGKTADISIFEGAMGLFDGKDGKSGVGSTAEVAKILKAPVILVIDCSSQGRSVAAVVQGFAQFDPQVKLKGVILNRVGSVNHEEILRDALSYLKIPVLGAIPRGALPQLPSRHLGLVPMNENGANQEVFNRLAKVLPQYLDFEALLKVAQDVEEEEEKEFIPQIFSQETKNLVANVKVGYAWDEAFSFYYQDALEYLEHLGATLVPFSPLHDSRLPEGLDGLILGGGFPEVYAQELSANTGLLRQIRQFGLACKPIYAECGGLMYLTQEIIDFQGNSFSQVGLIPARAIMQKKLQALGYYQGETLERSILGPKGTKVKGHEFHYSVLEPLENFSPAVTLHKGKGREKTEGFIKGNIYASYLHQHWAGEKHLAQAFLRSCLENR
ncbi:MAG: cobyrinate a,c-diamide synthase [Clostridia bacterium]|nr:cobyrinate a,c-diamide synthase [Clostridia bacterium]